ncbi:MAG: PDZ domain-containing protein [archaeon]|nr:PDZ domain-containing protein [archaeon]
MKIKFTWKIWLLIFVLALSLLSIFGFPPKIFEKGIMITSVEQNSTAFEQGLRTGQIITSIDGASIQNLDDFSKAIKGKFLSNENIKTTIKTRDNEYIFFSNQMPEITVSEIPKTNIKTGLDLSGGARALVKAKNKTLSSSEITDLVDITKNRFNVYGLSDMNVVGVSDLTGNHYMLIEIAGATPKDLEDLISQQGKFEGKIGDEVVFSGGDKDISSVSRSGQDSGVYSCEQSSSGYYCNFRFVVYLTEDAAKRHANVTSTLGLNESNPQYLSKKFDLYLDGKLVESLFISKDLKGRVTTQIQIQGSGTGETQEDAIKKAEADMKQLQTVLITGSLPYELEIVKLDTISPTLGKEFTKLILIAGLAALFIVSMMVLIRYRKWKSSLASIFISTSELIITLGIASLISWNMDLASIAGVIAAIGTGVDDQIVILDESRHRKFLSIKERLKSAFFIILSAYFTALVSLLPLMWAGAGLLKGFAITTFIGITVGVLITRPAFIDIIKNIEE